MHDHLHAARRSFSRSVIMLRRHVVATQLIHIGKEANKWEGPYWRDWVVLNVQKAS